MKLIDMGFIKKIVGGILLLEIVAFIFCIPTAIIFKEPVSPFVISAGICAIAFAVLKLLFKKNVLDPSNMRRNAYVAVTVSWLIISLLGTMPYLLSNSIPDFINAFFESMSGFTTTGSSILTDIEALPKSVLFWRDLTHWIGGIGIIVLVIIIIPSIHEGTSRLFSMESSLNERIRPRIRSVGLRLLIIYVSLTVVEVILLRLGGMDWYNSICNTFGTISTGGFSPSNNSIADYSPYIQYIIMIFMLLSGTSFVIHYYLFKGNLDKIKHNDELRFYLTIILFVGGIITAVLYMNSNLSFEHAFRESFFQVISIITCTGFATADYLKWPSVAWVILFFAMFFGGSTGSTAGGIKIARHVVLFKNIGRNIKSILAPKAIIGLQLNRTNFSEEDNRGVMTFISVYISIFILSTLILSAIGLDFQSAAGSVATSLAGIGPGLGSVGPAGNFAHLPDVAKLFISFLMLVGRLEIFTLLIIFSPTFWKL